MYSVWLNQLQVMINFQYNENAHIWYCIVFLCLQLRRITERHEKGQWACFWEWTEECCCMLQPYQCELISVSNPLPSAKKDDVLGFIFPFLFGIFYFFCKFFIIEFPIFLVDILNRNIHFPWSIKLLVMWRRRIISRLDIFINQYRLFVSF